jgi:hypothetical protein
VPGRGPLRAADPRPPAPVRRLLPRRLLRLLLRRLLRGLRGLRRLRRLLRRLRLLRLQLLTRACFRR